MTIVIAFVLVLRHSIENRSYYQMSVKGITDDLFSFLFSLNQIGTLHSCLRFLKVVCLSCSKLELHLPDDFHFRLLASTLNFLRLLELNKTNCTDAPKNNGVHLGKINDGHQSGRKERRMTDQEKGSESEGIVKEGYCLVVSLFEGCDPVLLPDLLEGLGDEIVSSTLWPCSCSV